MAGAGSHSAPASSTADRMAFSLPFRSKLSPGPASPTATCKVVTLPFRFKRTPASQPPSSDSRSAIQAYPPAATQYEADIGHSTSTTPATPGRSLDLATASEVDHLVPAAHAKIPAAAESKMLKAYDPLLSHRRLPARNLEPSRGRRVRQKILTSTLASSKNTTGSLVGGNHSLTAQMKYTDKETPTTDVKGEDKGDGESHGSSAEGIEDLDTFSIASFSEDAQKGYITSRPAEQATPLSVASASEIPVSPSFTAFPPYLPVPGVLQPNKSKHDRSASSQRVKQTAEPQDLLATAASTSKVRRFKHSQPKISSGHATSRVELVRGSTCLFIMEMAPECGGDPDQIMELMQYDCMDEIMLAECGWNPGDVQAVMKECERLGLSSDMWLDAEWWLIGSKSSSDDGRDSGFGFAAATYPSEEGLEDDSDSDSDWDCEPVGEAVTGSKVVVEGWWSKVEDKANRDWGRWRSPDIGPLGGGLRHVPRSAARAMDDDGVSPD